jgi:hypothetical protein
VDDEGLSVGVSQDVAGLVAGEVPVDRHRVGAESSYGECGLEERKVVAQHDRDGVARAYAEGIESGGRLPRAGE